MDTKRLRELLEAATPGPWVRSTHGFQIITADSMTSITETDVPGSHTTKYPSEEKIAKHKACLDLIVAAVNALPTLLEEREKLIGALQAVIVADDIGKATIMDARFAAAFQRAARLAAAALGEGRQVG